MKTVKDVMEYAAKIDMLTAILQEAKQYIIEKGTNKKYGLDILDYALTYYYNKICTINETPVKDSDKKFSEIANEIKRAQRCISDFLLEDRGLYYQVHIKLLESYIKELENKTVSDEFGGE